MNSSIWGQSDISLILVRQVTYILSIVIIKRLTCECCCLDTSFFALVYRHAGQLLVVVSWDMLVCVSKELVVWGEEFARSCEELAVAIIFNQEVVAFVFASFSALVETGVLVKAGSFVSHCSAIWTAALFGSELLGKTFDSDGFTAIFWWLRLAGIDCGLNFLINSKVSTSVLCVERSCYYLLPWLVQIVELSLSYNTSLFQQLAFPTFDCTISCSSVCKSFAKSEIRTESFAFVNSFCWEFRANHDRRSIWAELVFTNHDDTLVPIANWLAIELMVLAAIWIWERVTWQDMWSHFCVSFRILKDFTNSVCFCVSCWELILAKLGFRVNLLDCLAIFVVWFGRA